MTVLIKFSGCALIIFCCFVFGEYLGLKIKFRLGQLSEIGLGIGFLAGDIEMNLTPVGEGALKIAERLKEPVSVIFKNFGERLGKGESVERAWVRALTYNFDLTYLKAEDVEGLYPLGKILECLDVERQEKGLESIRRYIASKVAELEGEMIKARGLYRSISVLGGIFAAVVLF